MNGICVTYDGITKHCGATVSLIGTGGTTKEMLAGYNCSIHLLTKLYIWRTTVFSHRIVTLTPF